MINGDKLKNIVSKKAKGNNALSLQYYQMFFFEHILMRIAKSEYKNNIILKGGLLLSSIIGEDLRTTKDMDATLKSISLDLVTVQKIFNEILNINLDDNISFEIITINDIRANDEYGGFQLNILARLEKIRVNLFVELTTGDIITPKEINYKYKSKFDDKEINIMAYTLETVLAEKFEALISRGTLNTRMKDYYDLFMLISSTEKRFNNSLLVHAIENTFKSRETNFDINLIKETFDLIKDNTSLKEQWKIYQRKMIYAANIDYSKLINTIDILIHIIETELVVA